MLEKAAQQARKLSLSATVELQELLEDPGDYLGRKWSGEDRWNEAQVRFVHHARTAARRALYYVKLLEADDDGDADSEDGVFQYVRKGVMAQLGGPLVPDVDHTLEERRGREAAYTYSGARKASFEWLIRFWRLLHRDAERAETIDRMRRLEKGLKTFIRWSEPHLLAIRWNYVRAPALVTWIRQHLGFLVGAVVAVLVFVGAEPVWSLFRANGSQGVLAMLAALFPVGVLFLAQWIFRRGGRAPPWDLGGPAARAWAPVSYQPEDWIPRHRTVAGRVYLSLVLKLLLYLLLWMLTGAALQGLTPTPLVEPVAVTIYLVAAILSALALLGAVVDYADIHSQAPLRIWLLGGAAAYIVMLLAGTPMWFGIVVLVLVFAVLVWWAHRVRQSMVWGFAALILAVAIGVEWSTHVRRQNDLWVEPSGESVQPYLGQSEWPFPAHTTEGVPLVVMAASGGGSRAAIYTARTLEALKADFPSLARHLEAVSSVSGGSLANAGWVVQEVGGGRPAPSVAEGCQGSLSARVSSDFLRPTLVGVLPWMGGRGRSIEGTWRRCPGLGDVSLDTLKVRWREATQGRDSAPPFPIPLFNSTMLHRHRVVLTPLDRSLYATPTLYEDAQYDNDYYRDVPPTKKATWVVYRSGIYGLDDLLEYDPKLTQVVRASANFPFGFPLVELEATREAYYSPIIWERTDGPGVVRLTDGGALSNSGMWSLFSLLMSQKENRNLKDRPILLLIVEVSRMPRVGSRNRLRGLLQTIQDKHPKGENLHHRMLEELSLVFGPCFRSVQIDLPPLAEANVYTTWALDRHALAVLDSTFAKKWRTAGAEIRAWQESLPDCSPAPTRPSRVPVS